MDKYISFLIAYLLGSVPTAIWISKFFYKKDIRNYGSGNAGSTNMYRVFGFKAGLATQIVDILKGYIAAMLPFRLWKEIPSEELTYIILGHGFFAILGHVFPLFASFKGGKGINTLLGVMLAVMPEASLVGVLVFVVVLLLSKYVSLASMTAVFSLPVYLYLKSEITGEPLDIVLFVVGILLFLGVIYTHRSNIRRILKGTENKAGFLTKKK